MNRTVLPRIGLLAAAVMLLAACELRNEEPLAADPLPPCTASGSMFQGMNASDMAGAYHYYVGNVVQAHFDAATAVQEAKLQCAATDARSLVPPSEELKELAKQLPPWSDPDDLASLSSLDTSAVLLEALRVYECSLLERQYFLPVTAERANRGDFVKKMAQESADINKELRTSRAALERVLLVLGGVDRLRPLAAEVECVKRATLDLRNSLGLMAEAMSCMPRAFDARGSLIQSPPSE